MPYVRRGGMVVARRTCYRRTRVEVMVGTSLVDSLHPSETIDLFVFPSRVPATQSISAGQWLDLLCICRYIKTSAQKLKGQHG
jgi:hypothetical protein